jgi:hypothetical protein
MGIPHINDKRKPLYPKYKESSYPISGFYPVIERMLQNRWLGINLRTHKK